MSEAERVPTTRRLADALQQANAPAEMISRAESGYYDDFKGPLAQPIMALVQDASKAGLADIAMRAIDGEFDAPAWESEAWATNTPEGRAVMAEFFGGGPRPRPRSAKMKFRHAKRKR